MLVYFIPMDLKTYLTNHRLTEAAFAEKLGVSQVTVNRYVLDKRFPSPEMIQRIAAVTGGKVKASDWYPRRPMAVSRRSVEATQ